MDYRLVRRAGDSILMKSFILLITLLLPSLCLANPFDAFGVGTRTTALGGAGTASSKDSSANYYNPAALTKIPGLRLDLGYLYIQPELSMNNGNLGVDRLSGIYTGVTLPKKIFEQTLAVSLSFFLPDDRLTRIRSLPQRQPRFVLFDNRPQRVVIITSAAWEPVEGLSIGAGLTYLTNTRGTVNIDGTFSLDPEENTLFGGIDVGFESVRYPTAAMHWDISRNFSVGLTFRESFELDLDLTVDANAEVLGNAVNLVLSSLNTNLFSPRQVSAGFQYQEDTWLVTADLTWLQWSKFKATASVISIDLERAAESSDSDEAAFPVPAVEDIIDPEFHDIFIARVGLENEILKSDALRLLSRVGYFYEPSPAPNQSGITNYADSNKHGTSIGFGLELLNLKPILELPLEIDWVFQAIWLESRDYDKENPADSVGDYSIHGVIVGSSLTLGVQF